MKSLFKFLDSYTREDRAVFFGRDQEITELYRRVFESKMLLVYGISGTGKSSLVNCGLASRFDESDWLPVNVRRGNNIVDSLNDAFNKQAITPLKKTQNITEKLQSIYLDHFKPVYLLFDQFEELFIFGSQEEKEGFISIVKEITESETQCRIIFIIREEFLAGMTEFEEKLPDIFTNRFRVEKMKRTNAISAVEGPCKVFGIETEPGFPEELIDKLCPSGNEIELTYLQIYLDRIFRLATGDRQPATGTQNTGPGTSDIRFSSELLAKAGSVSDLLGQFLDEQIREMEDPETGMAILKSFVSVQGTRRQMSESEIQESIKTFGSGIAQSDLLRYLEKFVDLRILRERDEAGHYELRHDALAGKIYEKFTAIEKDIIEVRQFIENAWHDWEKREVLLSSDDLEYIAPYESRLYLSKEQSDLIERSKRQLIIARRRRRNIAIAATFTLLVIFAGFTIWALRERILAREQRNKALAEKYNFIARDMVATNPTKALRMAEYASSLDSGNMNILNNIEKIYHENNIYSVLADKGYLANSIVFFPDGNKLLAGCSDKVLRILDLNGKELMIIRQESEIGTVAISKDGQKILTGSDDNIARLYDINGKLIQLFKGHTGIINSVGFSSGGDKILTASDDYTARLWDIDGNVLQVYSGHADIVSSAIFSPDNKFIATGSYDNTARLWDISGNLLRILTGPSNAIGTLKFTPDGKYLLAACDGTAALLWDLNGNLIQQFRGHQCSISTVDISPDGLKILTGSCDNTIRLWDLLGNMIQVLRGHTGYIKSVAFSPDGQNVITASGDNSIRLWDFNGGLLKVLNGHKTRVSSVAFSNDGNQILTGSEDKTVRLWDLYGNQLMIFTGHSAPVSCVAFSPDGQKILSGSEDKTARLWDLKGNVIQIFSGHTGPVCSCCFSPGGNEVLTGSTDNTIRLWSLEGNEKKTFRLKSSVEPVAFSPDGSRILSGSYDQVARLWDTAGKIIQSFKGHTDIISSVAFSPDGQKILTGSEDQTARLWNYNGQFIQLFTEPTSSTISSVAYSPDGERIATVSSYNNTARLWNIHGIILQNYPGHTAGIACVRFSPDGQKMITGSNDNTARIWSVKKPYLEFNRSNSYGILGMTDKLKYDIVTVDQIIKSGNEAELAEAADYFINEFQQTRTISNYNYLLYANKLYKKLTIKHPDHILYLLGLLKSYFFINDLKPSEKTDRNIEKTNQLTRNFLSTDDLLLSIKSKTELYRLKSSEMLMDDIKSVNKKFLSSAVIEDLIKANDFYSVQCRTLDSISMHLGFPECILDISRRLVNDKSISESESSFISYNCSNLSWRLILMRDFKSSLNAALLAAKADSSNEIIYTNLPLAYILNNDFEKAKDIYLKYQNKFYSYDDRPFKKVFLDDITDLENNGITHPDFEKVRELLKK